MTISLNRRGVSWVAELLEDARRIWKETWRVLSLDGDALHAKYASNEVHRMAEWFCGQEVGLEKATVTLMLGDVVCFCFAAGHSTGNSRRRDLRRYPVSSIWRSSTAATAYCSRARPVGCRAAFYASIVDRPGHGV
jgi:hypothetical protein